MTTFTPAEILRQHRPLLLAMEAIGWLHMAGKARLEFLRKHGGDKVQYNEKKWHDLETPPFPWDLLLEWTKRLYGAGIPNEAWPGSFKEFTEKHAARDAGLLGLLQAAHGIVSGIEKNLPKSTSDYLNQTVLHIWLSSPWGHPKRNLLADPPEILTPQGWRQLVGEIRRVLEELRDLGTRNVQDTALWRRWREAAIGGASTIRRAFLATLAETRLPNNDVTLWDQSYVAAALFKSAVAGALLNSGPSWTDGTIKNKVRWRLLTVALGTEHYEARSVKIGDWTGAWGAIQAFFDRLAELVEVDLAIGSLLYRDNSVSVFSFPGERLDEVSPANWINRCDTWIQEQVEVIARDLALETPPYVHLSDPTRSLVPIVQERKEALGVVAIPVHKPWDVHWSVPSEARGHVCPVCRVRLNGDPTSKTKPCGVCRDRRHRRRDAWMQGQLGYDTIWFDEVADRNGRLALLTLSLDVESWLSGDRMDSLRAQAIPEWFNYNKKVSKSVDNQTKRWHALPLHERLIQYFKKRIDRPSRQISTDGVLRSLIPNLEDEFSDSNVASASWERIYNRLVEDRSVAPSWDPNNTLQNAKWFVFQSFRKLSSPGRIYRLWREAEDFFAELLREFRQIAARSDNPWRVRRLVLVPQNNNGWRDLTLYNGRWRGQHIGLIYVRSLGGFVTASNLARLLQPGQDGTSLHGENIPLEEEDRFRRIGDMQVESVRELSKPHSHLGVYAPVIPIEISPLRFRVLVPLEAASKCVDMAISWWKRCFARVWDRLPMQVGVVGFPRKLPYQAVVEIARNLEETLKSSEETWQVEEVAHRDGITALRLKRMDGRSVLQLIPAAMPDGRDDVFYPYVVVEDQHVRFPRDFRHPEGRIYRHVTDLRPGDGIQVYPARSAALFMDSTAARFADWDVRYLAEWQQMRETWRLLNQVTPSKTSLQHLRSELSQLEKDWRTPEGASEASESLRRDMYRALLVRHLECGGAALDALTEAALQGILLWALEWHLSALKE